MTAVTTQIHCKVQKKNVFIIKKSFVCKLTNSGICLGSFFMTKMSVLTWITFQVFHLNTCFVMHKSYQIREVM